MIYLKHILLSVRAEMAVAGTTTCFGHVSPESRYFFFLFGSIFSVILSVKNNGYFKRFFLHHDLIYILSVNKWIIPYINCWDYYCYLWWHSSLIKWMEYMYLLKVLTELKNPNNGSLIIWYTI